MLLAGSGRTEQPQLQRGHGYFCPTPRTWLHLIVLSEVTFDLGPEQQGRVLPSLAAPLWASTSLSEGRSQDGKGSHHLYQHQNRPPQTFLCLLLGWKLFPALEASTSPLRARQAPHFILSPDLKSLTREGLGRRPRFWFCVALAECMTSLGLLPLLGSLL